MDAPFRPTRLDGALAALALAWGLVEDALLAPPGPAWLQLLTGAVAAAAIAFRRRAPVAVAGVVLAMIVLRAAADVQHVASITPLALLPIVVYSAARHARSAWLAAAAALGVAVVMLGLSYTLGPYDQSEDSNRLFVVALVATSAAAGWSVRTRWLQRRLARAERRELERATAAQLRAATLEERARIAGELRAAVAAAGAGIRRACAAATRSLGAGDGAAAVAPLAEVEALSDRTMRDLRHLLAVLRDADSSPAAAAARPGAALAPPRRPARLPGLARAVAPVAALAALELLEGLAGPRDAALAAATLAPLLWRGRAPLAAGLLVVALVAVRAALGGFGENDFRPTAEVCVAAWTLGRGVPLPLAAAGVAAAVAGMCAAVVAGPAGAVNDYVMLSLMVALTGAAGIAVRRRAHDAAAARAELERARTERADRLAAALAAERDRVAHELHDSLGATLTVLGIYAGLARAAAPGDPAAAAAHAAVLGDAATGLETELRRLLEAAPREPELGELVARSGVDARLTAHPDLPPAFAPEVHRIVGEALTNVLKHAPGAPAAVELERDGETLVVRVRNERSERPPRGHSGGLGLAGMAERVRAGGGTLHAGPAAGGGWCVEARLPLAAAAAPRAGYLAATCL
jgi:signal transduction histidine kinase